MKIRPVNDRLLVRPFKAPDKKGLLYLPEQAQGEVLMGVVEAVGPGRGFEAPGLSVTSQPSYSRTEGAVETVWTDTVRVRNERAAIQAGPGDVVVYGRFAGSKVEAFGREMFLLREDELLAVVEDVPEDWKKENEDILRAAELGMDKIPEREEQLITKDDVGTVDAVLGDGEGGEPPPIKLVTP